MRKTKEWTRDQLLLALRLYMRTPFGKLHGKNPEIIELASRIGRSPNALAMKASNFASIDPKLDRKGLPNSSRADQSIWAEFESNPTRLAIEAEEATERLQADINLTEPQITIPSGESDGKRLVRVRRIQSFFRSAVTISYQGKCALSGIAVPELLTASHIIPWSDSVERRADPTNGLLLNALFDRAFDRGLIGFDDEYRVLVSSRLPNLLHPAAMDCCLLQIAGQPLAMPKRFVPDRAAIAYHRTNVFKK
ncbi:MAG TPA: HNH endonuclease [Fimbriiglobus sp.]|jgi:hypothetical protein